MKRTIWLFCFLLSAGILVGQITQLELDPAAGCSYAGEAPAGSTLYGFESSEQAQSVVQNILRQVGLSPNFVIKAANVPNAQAHISRGERYILYSEQFMSAIYNQTGDYWSQVTILAHEIGHHLNGHTLQTDGSRPVLELEADQFSGFVLYKLGASLPQAQAAVTALADEDGSATHPPKNARLEAIAVGYREARELAGEATAPEPADSAGPDIPPGEAAARPAEGHIAFAGKSYATVTIDGQTWLNENLAAETGRSFCAGNDTRNCARYGRLYTHTEAKKLCAQLGEGWRLPTLADWEHLVNLRDYGGFHMQYGGYANLPSQPRSVGTEAHYWTGTGSAGGYYHAFVLFSGKGKEKAWDHAGVLESKGRYVRCVRE